MWLCFKESLEHPQVYVCQQTPGSQFALISKANESLSVLKDENLRKEACLTFVPLFQKSLQSFVRSIAEPISIQQSMHQYSITPYGLLGGQSIGYSYQTVLCGISIIAWKMACDFRPRRIESAMQIELVCIFVFVQSCIALWAQPGSKYQKIPSETLKARFHLLISALDAKEAAEAISYISGAFDDMLKTTCLYQILYFVFLSYQRYGKFALVQGPNTAREARYCLESAAEDEVTQSIADRFGLSITKNTDNTRQYTLHIPKSQYVDVKSHIVDKLQYSVTETYEFAREPASQQIPIALRESVNVRPYQRAAWNAFAPNGKFSTNGLIVLPCGAGKTLVGIGAICIVKRPAIVVCPSAVSVEQWRNQFHEFTARPDGTPSSSLIYRCTSKSKDTFSPATSIVLTTYAMLSANIGKQSKRRKNALSWISTHRWGLVVFDEVHSLPAVTFQRCIRAIPAQCLLGLTATLLREDDKVKDLTALVGPKLYEATWWDLHRSGYIANVSCQTIICPTQGAFLKEYYRAETPSALRLALAACNPIKLRQCVALAAQHARKGDKVLVFADSLHALKLCQDYLRCPAITGSTPHNDRMRILFEFQYVPTCSIVCISRVGDTSINLPAATVLIQVSAQGGSRRQELQRIGRLLRPKLNGGSVVFYSLISENTHEERFATRRRNFLVQQGYFCELHRCEIDAEATSCGSVDLPLCTEKEILDGLSRLVCKWRSISLEEFLEKKALFEANEFDAEEMDENDDELAGVTVRRGTLTDLSVEQNLLFAEYDV